jgi:very-short-patch-repair endonuclease
MKEDNVQTEPVAYPCPICGKYNVPEYHQTDGKAIMRCKDHGLYKTSVSVSLNFRKFCKKLGSAPNRSPVYYTSSERKLRDLLLNIGLIEGLDFYHNSRISTVNGNGRKIYFWIDFIIPKYKMIVECNITIWHSLWQRGTADLRKKELIEKLGWKYIGLNEKEINKLNKELLLEMLIK